MRPRRIKFTDRHAIYHLISRTVAGERLLEPEDREVMRCQMWKMAAFCGVEVLTFCILSNHFHILARVPPKQDLSDAELLRRYAILYDKDEVAALEESLASDARNRVREGLLKRMHDVSFFMKEYRFCGYAEAVAGGAAARGGLRWILGMKEWREASRDYRVVLFGTEAMGDRAKEGAIAPEASCFVMAVRGELSLPELLRCRLRYFSDGLALGSKSFVMKVREALFGRGKREWSPPEVLAAGEDGLCLARRRRVMRGER